MSVDLKELVAQRKELGRQITELSAKFDKDKGQWATDADREKFEDLDSQYKDVDAAVDSATQSQAVLDRLSQIQASTGQPTDVIPPSGSPHDGFGGGAAARRADDKIKRLVDASGGMSIGDMALAAWMRGQYGCDVPEHEQEACKIANINPNRRFVEMRFGPSHREKINQFYRLAASYNLKDRSYQFEERASKIFNAPLTTTDPTSGGNLVIPETLLERLERNMLAFGGMREISELMITSQGETLGWPTSDDTGNKASIVPENTNVDNSRQGGPNPTYGKVQWGAFKYSSHTILVPYELLQDSVVDLVSVLMMDLGERIARGTNEHFTVGAGTTEPVGIMTAAEQGVVAGSIALDGDDVIRLQHSLDPAYRQGAVFMCHDSTIMAARLLKDGQGRYLWQDSLQDGTPDRLAGSPVVANQDMPVIEASSKPLLFTQPRRYKIRRAGTVRFYRMQERYRDQDQDGFVMFLREDGNLLNAGTNPAQYLEMPAS